MNIWTERLARRHLPVAERWAGRAEGALTPNDLPECGDAITQWFDCCEADSMRQDYLISVYETPVGLAALRWADARGTAELSLLLGEVGYNPLRTATYAVVQMLERAFGDFGAARVTMRVDPARAALLEALHRMGFVCANLTPGQQVLTVERETFRQKKYLF